MVQPTIGLADLVRILEESAGPLEGDNDDVIDTDFIDLGYDSIAVMEAMSRITREYGVKVGDDSLLAATTPRLLLDLINAG